MAHIPFEVSLPGAGFAMKQIKDERSGEIDYAANEFTRP